MTSKLTPQGFTLIETLVAVLLLAVAIAGPLTIASKGLSTSLVAKDQVAAFYLAQDAVEYVRFKRDSNCLAAGGSTCGAGWTNGLQNCVSASGCYVDSIQDSALSCPASPGACPVLRYDATNKFFTYGVGGVQTPQRFVRTVIITQTGDEAALSVKVEWTGPGGIKHGVVVLENLLNWQ